MISDKTIVSAILLFLILDQFVTQEVLSNGWSYEQSSGDLYHNGQFIGKCYSGKGRHKNVPESESIKNFGPIPRGNYSIGAAYNHRKLGPTTMNLNPIGGQNMFGRDLFRIHGDSSKNPGQASDGCIICGPALRRQIARSRDKTLTVVQ